MRVSFRLLGRVFCDDGWRATAGGGASAGGGSIMPRESYRSWQPPALIAHEQSGHHNGDRTADVNR